MVGLGVDHRVYRLRRRRLVVQDLHGPFSGDTPCWPAPYRHPIESDAQADAISSPIQDGADAVWVHGQLTHAIDDVTLENLRSTWGERRTAGAQIGPIETVPISEADRRLIAQFCSRGWQRLLVRAFEHVGCKASHLGLLTPAALADYGDCGDAILQAKARHRLAVLEELLLARNGDVTELFGALDAMDQSLDQRGGNTSWTIQSVPEHVRSLWPMRNLMRSADRMGVCFQPMRWQSYEDANTYAPELHILALEPDIYGAGVEHDITHYLETVFWSSERVPFEVGNNGSEGDGQAMNNLILACRYSGPEYEGYAGWPGAQLFEWLERAFQVTSIPQLFGVLRTFTVVLHREFTGDPREVLRDLVPGLVDGSHLDDLLRFYPGYVQHDHDFLGRMHPRYLTPVFQQWRDVFGELITNSLEEHVTACDDMLWDLEDIDLRTFDLEVLGRLTASREQNRIVGKKLIELAHLVELAGSDGAAFVTRVRRLLERVLSVDKEFNQPIELALELTRSPLDASEVRLLPLEEDAGRLSSSVAKYHAALQRLVENIRSEQPGWSDVIVPLDDTFMKPDHELFRGYYFEPAIHIGSDDRPGPKRLGEYESVA